MNNNKKGPWDLPIRTFIKTFPIVVTIYDPGKDDKVLHEIALDYGNADDRKWLGRLSFWALNEGYIVESVKKN